MRLVLLIALLTITTSAHADVVSLTWAVYTFFVTLTVAQVVAIAAVGISVLSSVYGSKQARKQGRQLGAGAAAEDRFTTLVTNESPHIYVYGRARVPARVVNMMTSGAKDEYKHIVAVFASHECDGIEQFYVAGKALGTLDVNGFPIAGDYVKTSTDTRTASFDATTTGVKLLGAVPVSGTLALSGARDSAERGNWAAFGFTQGVDFTWNPGENFITWLIPTSGRVNATFNNATGTAGVRVKFKLGVAGQTVESFTQAEVGGGLWPNTAVLAGHTYAIFRLDLNWPEFQSGLVSLEALVRGRKLFDPRSSTTYWSQNNALAILDYLKSPVCSVPSADIPTADCITAANVCDAAIGGANPLAQRYNFDGLVNTDRDPNEILEAMAESMAGSIDATTWSMVAGDYTAPVMTLDQSDIVGQITINPAFSDTSINNGVKGKYIGSDANYLETEYKTYQDSVYRTADGYDIFLNRNFEFTSTVARVHNLCSILTEDVRNGFTITAEFSHKAWKLRVGQRVAIRMPFFGIPLDKVFRIIEKTYGYRAQVSLTLKEDDASIWDSSPAVVVDATPNTNLANPFFVAPIAGLTCVSGTSTLNMSSDGTITSRIKASWTAASTAAVFNGGEIELQWIGAGETTWNSSILAGHQTEGWCTDVLDGEFYIVRVRGVNPYQNVRGDWRTFRVRALGQSVPPANVAGFTATPVAGGISFTWNEANELDYARTILHVESVWTDALPPLYSAPGTAFLWFAPAVGTYTVLAKHEDFTSNRSIFAASVTFTVSSPADVIVPSAKNQLVIDYNFLVNTHAQILATATSYGVSSATYAAAYAALVAYMATLTTPVLWSNDSGLTVIVSSTFRTNWNAVYVARDALLDVFQDTAQTLAGNAQTSANNALTQLTNIGLDSILSPVEKPSVVLAYNSIISEQAGIQAQATSYSVSQVAYNAAVTALTSYLSGLSGWNTIPGSDVTIVGATFRTNFQNVYDARQALLNAIAAAAKVLADNAQTSANSALTLITNIGLDTILSPGEKPAVLIEYDKLTAENALLIATAASWGISSSAYVTAYNTLIVTYLPSLTTPVLWSNTSGNTTLVAATWRANWTAVLNSAASLRDAIAVASRRGSGGNLLTCGSFKMPGFAGYPGGWNLYGGLTGILTTSGGPLGGLPNFTVTALASRPAANIMVTGDFFDNGGMRLPGLGIVCDAVISFYARSSAGTYTGKMTASASSMPAPIDINNPNMTTSWQRYAYQFSTAFASGVTNGQMDIFHSDTMGAGASIELGAVQVEYGRILSNFAETLYGPADTPNLTPDAATSRVSAQGSFTVVQTTYPNEVAATLVTEGKQVSVFVGITAGASGSLGGGFGGVALEVRVMRGATLVYTAQPFNITGTGGFTGGGNIQVGPFTDTPAAGTYSYKVQCRWMDIGGSPFGVTANVADCALICVENKV